MSVHPKGEVDTWGDSDDSQFEDGGKDSIMKPKKVKTVVGNEVVHVYSSFFITNRKSLQLEKSPSLGTSLEMNILTGFLLSFQELCRLRVISCLNIALQDRGMSIHCILAPLCQPEM